MPTYYYANNPEGERVFSTFPNDCIHLLNITANSAAPIKITINGDIRECRFGLQKNDNGTMYVITTEEKYVKSFKLFKELVSKSGVSLKSFIELKESIVTQQNEFIQDLIHNLTSINTYSRVYFH